MTDEQRAVWISVYAAAWISSTPCAEHGVMRVEWCAGQASLAVHALTTFAEVSNKYPTSEDARDALRIKR